MQTSIPMQSPLVPPDLAHLSFLDALSLDPRPSCVFDLYRKNHGDRPVFCNLALENTPELYNNILLRFSRRGSLPSQWTSFTINDRWKVLCASSLLSTTAELTSPVPSKRDSSGDILPSSSATSESNPGQFRFTNNVFRSSTSHASVVEGRRRSSTSGTSPILAVEPRIRGDSAFVNFFRDFDWSSTDLGPIKIWPQQLIELCNLMLASPDPIGIYWGRTPVVLYNEPVVASIGDRHPNALGKHMGDVFPEVWDGQFRPLFEDIVGKSQPWLQYNDRRVGYRNGNLEEVFWNVTFIPIFDSSGEIVGTWGTLHDVTAQTFWQRRIATLLKLTALMNESESFDAMWSAFVSGFEGGNSDVPHMLVYTIDQRPETMSGPPVSTQYRLRTCFGCATVTAPYAEVDIVEDGNELARLFKQTSIANVPMCFDRANVDFPPDFWDSFNPGSPDAICKSIVVIPIRPAQAKSALAYVVIGLHPLVTFDQHYREFIDLAQKQVASTMTSILLREEEVRRERLVAEEASAQLSAWKEEAEMYELRFTRLAETAPIGICTYSVDGSLTYSNDVYCGIFGVIKGDEASGSDWWNHLVHPEDLDMARSNFGRLLLQRQAVTFEIRVKAQPNYKAKPVAGGYIWLLVSAYAEPTGDGPQTVIACFTDINETKRAEDEQRQRLEDMINAKKQQEAFIDMTSHEIRNPLSVVLQCSEEIISACTLSSNAYQHKDSVSTQDLDNILDAAETIEFCTLHQKRIVDDILTLSKLESGLLPVTPDHVQPTSLVDGVMKLFEREIRKCDMKWAIDVHPTFHEYHLEHVLLDPSRVSQIMINLVSNAIKFTKTQSDRQLNIMLGGSSHSGSPSGDWPVSSYMPRQHTPQQAAVAQRWTTGHAVHLHLAVLDTGAGMSDEEQQNIFNRFTQASPRTHVKYGGSGLGLYICRALCETHGGQIGCTSVSGKGSAFGFHVEVGSLPQQQRMSTSRNKNNPSLKSSSSTTSFEGVSSSKRSSTTTLLPTDPIQKSSSYHVLVVEDNLLNQKVLRRQLENVGHKVSVAHHGEDALEQLRRTRSWTAPSKSVATVEPEQPFDFILMDVEMPVMDGLTCTRRIREWETGGSLRGHVPIIATTGNARDEKIAIALAAGMDKVVLKPYSLSVLLPIARELTEKYGGVV